MIGLASLLLARCWIRLRLLLVDAGFSPSHFSLFPFHSLHSFHSPLLTTIWGAVSVYGCYLFPKMKKGYSPAPGAEAYLGENRFVGLVDSRWIVGFTPCLASSVLNFLIASLYDRRAIRLTDG